MRLSYLVKGLPGHPLHPPLTDATIGIYTAAAVFGVLSAIGVSERNTATAWWLTLVIGLIVTVPTALTSEPAHRAVAPVPTPEKEAAERTRA